MSNREALYRISRIRNRYLIVRSLEILLFASAANLLIVGFLHLLDASVGITITLSLIAAVAIILERVFRYKLIRVSDQVLVRYLNSNYPSLEQSADLLLRDSSSLLELQAIQQQKIARQFDLIYPKVKIPHLLPRSIIVLIICTSIYFISTSFAPLVVKPDSQPSLNLAPALIQNKIDDPEINFLAITITPPSYTGLKSFVAASPDLKIPEGSIVNWSIKFSAAVDQVQLLLSGKDSINLAKKNKSYSKDFVIKESGFYQIQWRKASKITRSDYYKIEISKDELPKIAIDNLSQFTQLSLVDRLKIQVQATLQDDYGLTNSTMVATVSKGSGESVKFREERLRFNTPQTISGKKVNASITLDLLALKMEAGDELYFYVEALDNKTPTPNYNRTETFFISIKDTVKQVAVDDDGLGVDLMPEYFRSQRQIIIDTEKLLKEKKKIVLQQFKFTSNELGYDQKVLRLRYGQFLGEEFEGQIGKASVEEDHDDHESTIEKFGHTHDKENEHNLVADKKVDPAAHQHNEQPNDPEGKENPLEAFAHNHDDGEQATFFVQSVRAKLKAALTVMWDAELYLRLYEPEKSLPYQYTALKLLKEISNDSRIYVHRTGFDPPPLKEEKRLSGDLAEIRNSTSQVKKLTEEAFPEIRKTLLLLEYVLDRDVTTLSANDKEQFHRAGQELAFKAIETPGNFLEGLTVLKKLEDGTMSKSQLQLKFRTLQKIFWKVIPSHSVSPTKVAAPSHDLDQQFKKSLVGIRND